MCATVSSPTPFIEQGVAGRECAGGTCMSRHLPQV